MKPLLVGSTDSGTGKTAIAIALAKLAQDRGHTVAYMKPKGTTPESAVGKTRDQDPALARTVLSLDAEMRTLEPVVYSPTFVTEALRGREQPAQLAERIRTAYETLAEDADIVIIEGGDRLITGGIVELTDSDIASLLNAELLLVGRYTEGRDVDDVLGAATLVDNRFKGVVFNDIPTNLVDEVIDDVQPFLSNRGIETYGGIPHDEELAGVSVGDLVDSLGAELLTSSVDLSRRVERFTVGAMSGDAALSGFRRTHNSAVITGGDRSEIQSAALEASGVVCLILTGGHRPPSAILNRAETEGLPVLQVAAETRSTIDRTEEVLRSGRTQRPETVDRMATLIEERVDVDALLEL